jgi:hypothetical protein
MISTTPAPPKPFQGLGVPVLAALLRDIERVAHMRFHALGQHAEIAPA